MIMGEKSSITFAPNECGVFVGRLCPIHCGHRNVVGKMLGDCDGPENSLVVVGSSNAPLSLRHFFSYEQRRSLIHAEFGPRIRIVGLPDYPTDAEWLLALDDILRAARIEPERAVYYGGCEEDVMCFSDARRRCRLINRFDGRETPKISATEVRDALIHGRPLDGLVGEASRELVARMFQENWERFKRI